jgi:adenylylsulfate kinase
MTGVVVWVTGLPSAGKSTFAEGVLAALRERNAHACVLDGDAVRASIAPPPGYSPTERASFYETLARLAALLAGQGLVVLVPATAHLRSFRDRARKLAPAFIEVFVDTPSEECERRDAKKLYARSRSGEAHDVPGTTTPYERPAQPDLVAHGGSDRAAREALVAQLLRFGVGRAPAAQPIKGHGR